MKDVPDLCSVQRQGEKPSLCYHECPKTDSSHQPTSKHGKGKATADPGTTSENGDRQNGPWARGVISSQGEQMFTGLQQLVETADHVGLPEVILHSKFCSRLNQVTKPGIKHGT